MKSPEWKTYRTRFLVKAKQLSSTLSFTDPLGRQHCGRKGDYLVESSDGVISIAPRQIFEDIYVVMECDAAQSDPAPIATARFDEENFADRVNGNELNALAIEPLDIREVKLDRPSGRQFVAKSPVLGQDETARVRRKLPQPFRDRRSTPSRFSLM